MDTPYEFELRKLQERHAERKAVEIVNASSRTHCVKKNGFATALIVLNPKNNEEKITIQSREAADSRRWEKFLVASNVELAWLSHNVGFVGYSYAGFLLAGDPYERYLAVKRSADRKSLRGWGWIEALHRSLQYKYDTHNFCDKYAESEFGKVLMLQEFVREMNKAWNKHCDDEDRLLLVEEAYTKAQKLIESRTFEAFEPLPSLPTGIPDLLAMPDDEDDGDE